MKRWVLFAGLLAVVGVGGYLFIWEEPANSISLKPGDETIVSAGAQLYGEYCAACHGANLEGQPNWRVRGADGLLPAPPHDAGGHTWHHPDTDLFALTKYGVAKLIEDPSYTSAMQPYEDVLSDAEIVAVLSYIKSTWPAEIQARHDEINARATAKK